MNPEPDAPLLLTAVPAAELSTKLQISRLGIQFRDTLSFEEWSGLAPKLGAVARSIGFIIGDWLLYGIEHFAAPAESAGSTAIQSQRNLPRINSQRYDFACKNTGLDRRTLREFAYVSRNVPYSLRNDQLQWEHHRIVAKLPHEEQSHWLTRAADPEDRLSARRLRASILRGEVVPVDELALPACEKAIPTHITPINRLSAWWKQSGGPDWLKTRSQDQLAAMLRDFAPILQILQQLQQIKSNHDNPTC